MGFMHATHEVTNKSSDLLAWWTLITSVLCPCNLYACLYFVYDLIINIKRHDTHAHASLRPASVVVSSRFRTS